MQRPYFQLQPLRSNSGLQLRVQSVYLSVNRNFQPSVDRVLVFGSTSSKVTTPSAAIAAQTRLLSKPPAARKVSRIRHGTKNNKKLSTDNARAKHHRGTAPSSGNKHPVLGSIETEPYVKVLRLQLCDPCRHDHEPFLKSIAF